MKNVPTGIDDFKTIIEKDYLYIDKTLLIKEIIDDFEKPCCIIRPRRFCKSVNMSMLDYYFNINYKDNNLFDGLKIMEQDDKYLSEANNYPVISISFKDLDSNNYQEFIENYKDLMKSLYDKYEYLETSDKLDETDKADFLRIKRKEENILLSKAIAKLVNYLNKHYEKKVIVLLDEYDVPIIDGYLKGYYDEVLDFIKKIFKTTFKNNLNLKKGIVTGVFRVAIEELQTGANNFNTYDITSNEYAEYYGFTENEVKKLLEEYGLIDNFNDVKKWYDGYLFGNTKIYNPVSILNYLESKVFKSYWVNTGGVDLLKNLIYNLNNKQEILNSFDKLLKVGIIENVDLNIKMDLRNLKGNRNNIYTLFMLSGYLTPIGEAGDLKNVTLRIPNLEIKDSLESIANSWFENGPLGNYDFTRFLISHDLENFKSSFKNIVEESFSYYDVPNNHDGENFYHAFTLGLLRSSQSNFEITSNRESGYGRYDLVLKPLNSNFAYIIEFKLLRDNDFDKTIEEGFKQIEENKYELSLKDYDVTKMVIAFKGKKVKIETRK